MTSRFRCGSRLGPLCLRTGRKPPTRPLSAWRRPQLLSVLVHSVIATRERCGALTRLPDTDPRAGRGNVAVIAGEAAFRTAATCRVAGSDRHRQDSDDGVYR